MCCHVDSRLAGIEIRSVSGNDVIGLPIKTYAGDRTNKSFEVDDINEIGLEFKMPSISMVRVFSSSKMNNESLTTFFKWCLNFTKTPTVKM